MELNGFKSRSSKTPNGERLVEYYPEGSDGRKLLKLRISDNGIVAVELIENGTTPGIDLGECVTSPVHTDEMEKRLLTAMASHHFNADWLEDGHTVVDLEMIRRGFEVGKLESGELVWYRRENGATIIVKREESDQLPSSLSDPVRIIVVGITGKELVVQAMDYKSLLQCMDAGMHYEMYNPRQDIHVSGVYSLADITIH